MKVWNEIFNRKQISCIVNGMIHFSDGTKMHKNQPYADYKAFLKKKNKHKAKHYCVVYNKDGAAIWNQEQEHKNKTVGRIPNYYISIAGNTVETVEYKMTKSNEIKVLERRKEKVPTLR